MALRYCNNCNEPYLSDSFNTDFVHQCAIPPVSAALAQDDILHFHTSFSDYGGSGGKGPVEALLPGVANKVFGTRAEADGERVHTVTVRGNPVSFVRQRDHEEFNDNKK
mgnify:CR=1 FL=1